MSVDCTGYIGYAVTLKENLTSNDFKFFEDFDIKHGEYSQFDFKGENRVRLIVDGMNGSAARLIFVDKKIEECWVEGKDYFALKSPRVPDNVYDELNKAYKLMYNKNLEKSSIEYVLWFLFG